MGFIFIHYNYLMKILFAFGGILAGIFAMVFGEFDDSPGLQGLGMILIILILYRVYRGIKKSKNS